MKTSCWKGYWVKLRVTHMNITWVKVWKCLILNSMIYEKHCSGSKYTWVEIHFTFICIRYVHLLLTWRLFIVSDIQHFFFMCFFGSAAAMQHAIFKVGTKKLKHWWDDSDNRSQESHLKVRPWAWNKGSDSQNEFLMTCNVPRWTSLRSVVDWDTIIWPEM